MLVELVRGCTFPMNLEGMLLCDGSGARWPALFQ